MPLLLDEYPLIVQPTLATALGLNEAIIVQQIHYWIGHNQRRGDRRHYHAGLWWCWNTIRDWEEQFPWWSPVTIRRALRRLRKQGIVVTGNFNGKGYDRTLWYSLNYAQLDAVLQAALEASERDPCGQNDQMELFNLTTSMRSNCAHPCGQNDQMDVVKMSTPIPETSSENSMDERRSESARTAIWNDAKERIRRWVAAATYDAWIAGLRLVYLNRQEGMATVLCPTTYAREWCTARLDKLISRALAEATDLPVRVTYIDSEKREENGKPEEMAE